MPFKVISESRFPLFLDLSSDSLLIFLFKLLKGRVEEYEKYVKEKSDLNYVILDQSWFEFRRW